ncbi:hypothetical protein KPL71_001196 [Citrus sinensis]|uniref:Uncharacterized protein n=1 Tax=Citrus sinensis TaxID=2711 RepID=A0ACB8NW26_CITSI|nr:hypothetical protein KPL71_001196 [Citrus sinensis]
MLSAKKSTIATDNIEFLGMIIKDGHYQPGKHIAQELLHFPDQQLSKKQVQQFLGIINYIRDFIPHVDHYTRHLSVLLKKKPPEWNADHTNAVTTLKKIAQNPPPLKLITDGKRILQTDASDDSWGAILLEEINGKEHFIAYASGQFSNTQKHYHSVFKEILAVKNGIKKFEYHLIGHHFLIRMDSSAFPNILNFKELFPFSSFHPENLFLIGLTLDPSRETTEDVLWYIWYLTVLYANKLVLPITLTLEHLLDPDKATSLTWTLLEWFSPIPWWRKKLQQLSEIYNLERMPALEAQLFTSIFIIHRPYFQHPDTNLFWTQDRVYEWFTAPHPAVIDNEIQDVLHNYLCQLNHQPPPLKDIFHTSLGPQHDLLMIPTPSAISNPKSTGIIIKEERPDYTDFLYQDSQDPWEDFLPLSQHLQQFPQPSMKEPGSSSQPPKADTATKPSKVDKATQTSPRPGYRRDCPYSPCRGPQFTYLNRPKLVSEPRPEGKGRVNDKLLSHIAGKPKLAVSALGGWDEDPGSFMDGCGNCWRCWLRGRKSKWRRENFSFMASTSSSSPVTLSLPRSCTSHTTNKIENLVEYSYITESSQISESSYPLISPYQLYKRPSSFTRCIRTLISTRRPHPKEYIQSSRLDQCALQATSAEQYVTLEIPFELLTNWKREGYTHLHLGGIRLIFTLHGRKGLPVTVRLAMLDTRFKQHQDDVIGTVLTTLHAGSVLLTFYPNFNLSLQDPNLPTTLKVQVQIQGTEQISSAKIATLHHQLVYRLQNHALDLPTPEHHSDTLMVLAESDQIPTIIQIPRQIPRHELIKLMPLEWISNYEQFHNNTAPIQTSESMFERRQDGTIRMTFKPPPSAPQEPHRLSFTYSSMIAAVQTAQEDLPITGFNSEGYLVYPAKQNGHFLWDAPGSGMCDPTCPCWDDWDEDDDYATTRKKKPKKKKPPVSCHHYDPKPPQDPPPPPAPLPFYRKELNWIAKHCKSETPSPIPLPTPPLTSVSDSHTETDTESSVSTSDSEKSYADITRILMAQPDQPTPGQTSHTEPYVDIPSEVEEEMPKSSTTNQPPPAQAQTSPPSQKSSNGPWFTTQSVLREFATRFTGALRDWFDSLDELQPDIQRQLTASNLVLDNISLGKIFQLAKTCLDKLCEQKQFFKELLKDKDPFRSACKKPYLQIKCKKKKDCDCSPKKKRNFKKFRNPEFSSRPRRSRKPYRFFRKKSSSSRDFKRRKSSRCFICKKKGHYAKDCPNKREKSIRLVEHLQATTDYSPEKDELEFYFSEQDEPNDETMFALQNSSDDSDSDQSQVIFHQQLLSLDTSIPIPSIELQILPSKFQRPVPAIVLIDTGAQRSMLNPHILPPEYWTEYEEHFKAVNGKLFTTSLITKKPIVQTRLVPIQDHLWNLRRRFPVNMLKWGIKTFVKTPSFSGYLTQNRLSFSLKQGTKPDKNLFQKFSDAQDPYWKASAEHTSLGLDMADGVGIMRRSYCGPKEVWKMSFSGGGVVASFSTTGWGKTIQVVSRHQMYHNTSSVVSLDGSRVKPVRNRFSGWKEENGKGSVTRKLSASVGDKIVFSIDFFKEDGTP